MIFFKSEMVPGWAGIVTAFIEIPIVLVITYKIFPNTRFGKSVTLAPPDKKPGEGISDTQQLKDMLGAAGRVLSDLRPVGMVDFDGKRVECVAEEGYVEKGKQVKVIKVESTQLTVRVLDET